MSAAEALRAARAAGIRLGSDGDALTLEADAAGDRRARSVVAAQGRLVALLRPAYNGWSAEDRLAFFEEQADIAELHCELSRAEPEASALDFCVARIVIPFARHRAAALAAVEAGKRTTSCCRSEQMPLGMPACIRAAGRLGMNAEGPKHLQLSHP
jgi:hypothetical protein